MTKNRSMKIAVLVLALALLTSCFVGSTFAKYTSSGAGNATANVATWDVVANVNGTPATLQASNMVFDLFTTVTETDGTEETEVKPGIVAPGTAGSFLFTIVNKSDVDVEYSVVVDITNVIDPIEFSLDKDNWDALTQDELNEALSGELDFATTDAGNTSPTNTIYWRWAWTEDNENEYSNADFTLPVTISIDQVN